ncbi:T9SS outer membrane translocon Sov/SprA [Porphyromonas crevioricanis]|uniref:T9SS outer membrane translocon Sov/SprA n=1 Tax=Porphyromonas crevioricanis TaxID=393921 RepID=UPI0009DE250E|nr:cell surface protein SprA [Porphyromonas crevioricanis]
MSPSNRTHPYRSLHILPTLLLLVAVVLTFAQGREHIHAAASSVATDTLRFPVQPLGARDYRYLQKRYPMDLKTPDNIQTSFVYNPVTGMYLLTTTLGGKTIGTPIPYTPTEYLRYMQQRGVHSYFLDKDRAAAESEGKKSFNPLEMNFELGPAEKVFGPGGIRLRTQGSAEVLAGVKTNATENLSLPERARNHTFFDFNEKIQLSMQASVGSKLNFNMNYNTESSFDFDAKKLKLSYEGEEDDIIKLIEAGDVSMSSRNSLIQGGSSLFGIHSKMQFGKLDVDLVVSQQEAETKHVSTQGGAQTQPFELSADAYDENRHFFLGHYFSEEYDNALSTLPFISSGVKINRIEVWVTNKRGAFDEARNIVAFSDLGETKHISSPGVTPTGSTAGLPDNRANSLYETILSIPGARRIDKVTQLLGAMYKSGRDYEKIESARRLRSEDYTLNSNLGYLSLNTRLSPDEVLGVAFEYTYGGQVYQVGEFSTDKPDQSNDNLYVKLLKGTHQTPSAPYWDLMMKNIYSLGPNVYNVQADRFRLDIYYQSDSAGIAQPFINDGPIKGKMLLGVLGADRLDRRQEPYPDGTFDYVEGYTVLSQKGLIIFPTVQPFGKTLGKALGSEALAKKYIFQELYDTTAVAARQVAEKNKFLLRGEYQASTSGEISLGATNVTPGSVRVTAGGVLLTENVDYTVDYMSGTVRITNPSILASGSRIDVSLENRGFFNMQRKTMLGLDLNYNFSKDFSLGATVMHLSELPLTTKTAYGSESLKNTLWGINMSYRTKSQWLTNMFDALPLLSLTKPSEVSLNAEFAHLIPGHYEGRYAKGYSYLDDFESSQSTIDLLNPYSWMLSSTPFQDTASPLFPEAAKTNDLEYGNRRALLSWYYIDPLFTREHSSLTPSYLRNDLEQLSNHFVREIETNELFPYREESIAQQSYINTLNLTYYPGQRGPYNLNTVDMGADGLFTRPEKMWGGIMRKIDQSDFEASNIEYIEFWLMDPFVYDNTASGGDLYINLGEVSEEVLKDEKKFFENGMPINDDPDATETTVWGKVPKRQGTGYAFDNTPGARKKQDVGFNGLSTEEELAFSSYTDYIAKLKGIVSAQTLNLWQEDPQSPLNDPAGDNFHHYRGRDYDASRLSIIERYKYYNGTESNSAQAGEGDEFSVASRVVPDVEDINQDNTLNETEKYFEYRISLRPQDMQIGSNHIVDKRDTRVKLRNGQWGEVTWYQFKVPVHKYQNSIGGVSDFKTIRYMRMYLTSFKDETKLRFGTLKLVRGDWRSYTQELHDPSTAPTSDATMEVSAVNIEENGDRKPINYVLPPGVLRSLDPQQAQSTQQNEQSLSLKIHHLAPGDARAVYKNVQYDLRRYSRLQMFTHAERVLEEDTGTTTGDLYAFIRLGSDYRNNYYEYAVPLQITPSGVYSQQSDADRRAVWPDANYFDVSIRNLTNLKVRRNAENSMSGFYKLYSRPDPDNSRATISVLGNPSLSNVRTIMIGVRNGANQIKSVEIWVNELRVTDYQEEGGWAAGGNLNVQLSDLGNLNVRGRYTSAGFGALDQRLSQRSLEDNRQLNLTANIELGKLLPPKANVSIPLYYTISDEVITPQYNPLDQDVLLREALNAAPNKSQRDSIERLTISRNTSKSLSLANMRINIKSKNPMPYDPANFSFNYAFTGVDKHTPDIEYDKTTNWNAGITYDYAPLLPPFKPFAFLSKGEKRKEKQNANTEIGNLPRRNLRQKQPTQGDGKGLSEWGINLLPNRINLRTNLVRNYQEQQVRNFNPGIGEGVKLPATFMQSFIWDRSLSVNWNLTNSLRLSFRSGTNARIEEPHVQVNRELNPDQYKVWQDSVMMSLRQLGTPLHYDQVATASYTLPTTKIPALEWIDGSANYNATYNWDKGARAAQGLEVGNIIRNQLSLDGRINLSLVKLMRKIPYFKGVEERINRPAGKEKKKSQLPPPTIQRVKLKTDSTTIIEHGLKNYPALITAKVDGKPYPIRSRKLDRNRIEILNKDSVEIEISMTAPLPKENPLLQGLGDRIGCFLMGIRDFSLSYKRSSGLNLPGFLPNIQAAGGQGHLPEGLAPGLDFAFGLTDNSFVSKANEKGWLLRSEQNVNPAAYTVSDNVDAKLTLEPIKELRITLSAKRSDSRQTQTSYALNGSPQTYGGNFVMTIIGLKGFFFSADGRDGYSSPDFNNFLNARERITERIRQSYQGGRYPHSSPFIEKGLAGKEIDINQLDIRQNSPEVLIPAFLSSYTMMGNPDKIGLNPFPALASIMPNWNISYNGLSKLPAFRAIFSNFSIRHSYTSTYRVDSYTSSLSWVPASDTDDNLGFLPRAQQAITVQDQFIKGDPSVSANNNFIGAAPYEIPGVTLDESFYPLIGVDMTFLNGIGVATEWRKRRNIKLNLSAFQIIETSTNEASVALSYKENDFAKKIGLRRKPKGKKAKEMPQRSGGALTTRAEFSINNSSTLIRKIQDRFSQATAGNLAVKIKISADYQISRMLTFRAFYDWDLNRPLVSTASFPIRNSNFGVSLRFNLTQ